MKIMENERRSSISDMQLTIDEHHYTIKKHGEMLGEIHSFSKDNSKNVKELREEVAKHIKDEEPLKRIIVDLKKSVDKIEEDNQIVLDYVNKMAVGAWFMEKIKVIVGWFIVVGGGSWGFYEWIKHISNK